MAVGVQYRGTVPASATQRVFTYNWSAAQHVIWYVTPTSPASGSAQLDWDTQVALGSPGRITYWVVIRNLTGQPVSYEMRYAILS